MNARSMDLTNIIENNAAICYSEVSILLNIVLKDTACIHPQIQADSLRLWI